MNDQTDTLEDEPDKHLEGEGHAHHQFNPERAGEFREADRLEALKLDQLYEAVGIEPADHVLDLGTGSGALLPTLADALSDGIVIGADISENMLSMAREYASDKEISNVVLLRNDADQLTVHDETLDDALIVSSLHEFSDPVAMLSEVNRGLKPTGHLGILEWRHDDTPEGPPLDHRLTAETIQEWLTTAGFNRTDVAEWNNQGYDLYRATKSTD